MCTMIYGGPRHAHITGTCGAVGGRDLQPTNDVRSPLDKLVPVCHGRVEGSSLGASLARRSRLRIHLYNLDEAREAVRRGPMRPDQ